MVEQILIYKTLFFSIVTTISYAIWPVMKKSFYVTLVKICMAIQTCLVLHVGLASAETHHLPPHCSHIQCLVFIDVQQVLMNVSGYHIFLMEEFSDILLLCMHAPLLPSVACQQNVTEYCWERQTSTAPPPPSTSDVMGQHNRTTKKDTLLSEQPLYVRSQVHKKKHPCYISWKQLLQFISSPYVFQWKRQKCFPFHCIIFLKYFFLELKFNNKLYSKAVRM